jgi:hypothetical protein
MLRMPFLSSCCSAFCLAIMSLVSYLPLDLPEDYQEGTAVPAVVNDVHSKTLNCMTGNSFSHKMLCTVELGFGVPSLWVFLYFLHVFTILPELL